MTIVNHDFGKRKRQTVRRFVKLLNLDAVHEANVRMNPAPYLERASERIYQLETAIFEAAAAATQPAQPCAPTEIIQVDKAEYERLRRCLTIIEKARAEIDAHAEL